MTLLQWCMNMNKGFCSFPISQKINRLSLGFALCSTFLSFGPFGPFFHVFFLFCVEGCLFVVLQLQQQDPSRLMSRFTSNFFFLSPFGVVVVACVLPVARRERRKREASLVGATLKGLQRRSRRGEQESLWRVM
jgi:hypothetical protein